MSHAREKIHQERSYTESFTAINEYEIVNRAEGKGGNDEPLEFLPGKRQNVVFPMQIKRLVREHIASH